MKAFLVLGAVLAGMTALLPLGQALASPSMDTVHVAGVTSSQIGQIEVKPGVGGLPPKVEVNLLGLPFGFGLFNPFLGLGGFLLNPFLGVRAFVLRQLLLRQLVNPFGVLAAPNVEFEVGLGEVGD